MAHGHIKRVKRDTSIRLIYIHILLHDLGLRHAHGTDGLNIGGIDSYLDLWEIEKEMNAVIVAFITGGLSLIGVIITNISSNKKIENQLEVAMAVTNTKLDALTKQVEKHNQVIERTYKLEQAVEDLQKKGG